MSNHELSNIDLVKLLPFSLQNDEDTNALMQVLSEQLQKIYGLVDSLIGDEIPSSLLDFIAYDRHVDFYDFSLTDEQKRALIQKAKVSHQRKGTPGAIEEVVTAVYPGAEVIEWYDYAGQPFHFRIEVDSSIGIDNNIDRLNKMIDSVKRKSTILDAIKFNTTIPGDQTFLGAVTTTVITTFK